MKGDMSFIGPRPWIPEYYKHMTKRQRQRVSVKPGITGLAQASGRNSLSIHDKLEFDLTYVKNVKFTMDVKIVYMTLKTFLKRSNAELHKLGIHHELNELKAQPLELDPVYVEIETPDDIHAKLRDI
jgi:hypothetical protein